MVSPTNFILVVIALGLLAQLFGRSARLTTFGAVLFVICALGPLGDLLLYPLEARFERPATPPEKIDGAIVLGGGIDVDLSHIFGEANLREGGDRLLAGAQLARERPEIDLVLTGGAAGDFDEATKMATFFGQVGIAPERLILERRARNTRENALFSMEEVQPKPGETWLVVTSASHMPRSMGAFLQLCWNVTPWPTDYFVGNAQGRRHDLSFMRDEASERLRRLDRAVHEYIGLFYYWLRGWTPALFPGPETRCRAEDGARAAASG